MEETKAKTIEQQMDETMEENPFDQDMNTFYEEIQDALGEVEENGKITLTDRQANALVKLIHDYSQTFLKGIIALFASFSIFILAALTNVVSFYAIVMLIAFFFQVYVMIKLLLAVVHFYKDTKKYRGIRLELTNEKRQQLKAQINTGKNKANQLSLVTLILFIALFAVAYYLETYSYISIESEIFRLNFIWFAFGMSLAGLIGTVIENKYIKRLVQRKRI